MPKFSVIIPAYNCEKFVGEAIESVFNQTYLDLEIIVIDDGCTDSTKSVIKQYVSDKLVYIFQENQGVSTARNRGIDIAKGEYIAFLDCDDLWLPEKLEKQLELLEKKPQIALVFSDCYIIDSAGNILKRSFDKGRPPRGEVFNELLMENFIPIPTVVIRKKVFERIGGFDARFGIAADYHLTLRVAESFTIDFIDIPLAKYRIHQSNMSRSVDIGVYEELEIVDYWLNKRPELEIALKKKLKQRIATIYYRLGCFHLCNNQMDKARQEFLKVLSLSPFCVAAMISCLTTFIGAGLHKRLKKLKMVTNGFPIKKLKDLYTSIHLKKMFEKT